MAAARDQAARILRAEPDTAEGGFACDVAAAPPEQLRAQLAEETVARRPAETPGLPLPASDQPSDVSAVASNPAAPKSGKRKRILLGVGSCLRSQSRPMACIIFWSDGFSSTPTTPMCAPTTPRSAPG